MKSIDNICALDGKVPLTKALPFGFQHILTMFVSSITPIIIIAGMWRKQRIVLSKLKITRI